MFKKGLDKFNKTDLIQEENIGDERIKLELGSRLVLCSYYKQRCIEDEINISESTNIYRVEYSIDGYYDGLTQYHFEDKKAAKDFYKNKKIEMIIRKNKTLNPNVEEESKFSKFGGKPMPMTMNGMDEIAQAYISRSPSELDVLSKTNHPFIRLAVANNTFTSEKTLRELWKYSDYEMQLIILSHVNTEESLLNEVIEDNLHKDKVFIAKANLIRRDIVMNFSRVFTLQ